MSNERPVGYRAILDRAFDVRVKKNPGYSLRAFARDLEMPVSKLSEVLRGRRGISRKAGLRIAEIIHLSKEETEYFVAWIELEHARSELRRKRAQDIVAAHEAMRSFGQIDLERFRVIADWYHLAILELTRTKGFQSNAKWIAGRLGISEADASAAVKRLIGFELLRETEGGDWVPTSGNLATPSGIPSEKIREHHCQILDRAKNALEKTPIEKRDFSTVTLAVDSSQIEKARALLKEFRRRFAEEIQSVEVRDRVYVLGLQFFPLDAE